MKKPFILLPLMAAMSAQVYAQTPQDISTQDWVSQVYENRGQTKIRDMVIPGTHDSGTYNITGNSADSPDADGTIALAAATFQSAFGSNFIGDIIAKWAKTQSYDFSTMLAMGIRHFDLRIQKHNGEYYLVHSKIGMKLRDALTQVKTFADAHPKEAIILEVAKTPGSADMPAMLDMFDELVGARKPDASINIANLTLNDLWAADSDGKNNNIITMFISSSADGESRGYYGNAMVGTWANTTDSGPLHDKLLAGLKTQSRDKLFYSAFTYTPTTDSITKDIEAMIFSGKVRDLKIWTQDWLRSYLGNWVPNWVAQGYRPNVMTADFFEYTALVPLSIQLNMQAPQTPTSKLQVAYASGVTETWNSVNSGATEGSVFIANETPGFKPLASIPITGYWGFDHNVAKLLVKTGQEGVAKPLGYNWVWDDVGNGGTHFAQVWRPIAPPGFVCLGDVVTPSAHHNIAPSTDLIRCVHQSYVVAAPLKVRKWTDVNSGGDYDGALWDSFNPDGSAYNIGALRGNGGYSQPNNDLFKLILKSKTDVVIAQ